MGAQDKDRPTRHGHCLQICTYNCRTVSSEANLATLMEASKKIRYDVLALQETKVKANNTKKTKEGDLIALGAKVDRKNIGGVGFIIHRRITHLVDSIDLISPRIAVLRLRISKNTTLSVINGYGPTSNSSDEEKDTFYLDLQNTIKKEKAYYKIVCGDFNAIINEPSQLSARVGRHGQGETNENGERLKELLDACQLFHGNSMFQKSAESRWT